MLAHQTLEEKLKNLQVIQKNIPILKNNIFMKRQQNLLNQKKLRTLRLTLKELEKDNQHLRSTLILKEKRALIENNSIIDLQNTLEKITTSNQDLKMEIMNSWYTKDLNEKLKTEKTLTENLKRRLETLKEK